MFFSKKKRVNHRAYPRADFFQPSYFIVEQDPDQHASECWCTNISVGGMAFETGRGDLNDATVRILYRIGGRSLKDRLQVRHSFKLMSRYRYGCQFVGSDDRRSEIIERYVAQKIAEKESKAGER